MNDAETHFGSFDAFYELVEEASELSGLTDWEEQFITNLLDRIDEYGEQMYLSGRQADVLRRILDEKA